jgi:hypothetical protein
MDQPKNLAGGVFRHLGLHLADDRVAQANVDRFGFLAIVHGGRRGYLKPNIVIIADVNRRAARDRDGRYLHNFPPR